MSQRMPNMAIGVIPPMTMRFRLLLARSYNNGTDEPLEQEELSKLIGVSRKSIGRYERGEYVPPRSVLIAWALATGVDLDWLEGPGGGESVPLPGRRGRHLEGVSRQPFGRPGPVFPDWRRRPDHVYHRVA